MSDLTKSSKSFAAQGLRWRMAMEKIWRPTKRDNLVQHSFADKLIAAI
jgi:hypothetical protein